MPESRPPTFVVRQPRYLLPLERGRLEIQAVRATPGHQRVGYFRFGPSTFLALEGVRVVRTEDGVMSYFATARKGRLQANKLELQGRVRLDRPGRPTEPRPRSTIDLGSGRLRTR